MNKTKTPEPTILSRDQIDFIRLKTQNTRAHIVACAASGVTFEFPSDWERQLAESRKQAKPQEAEPAKGDK